MNDKVMRVGIYARVSTNDKGQDPELQLDPLRAYCKARNWNIVGEFIDIGQSGAKDKRPQLDLLLNDVRKRKLDCVVVWKLDRWGRSLKHLINSLSELQELGVSFVSYQENIDLSTPSGKMMFHVVGAMAEFERSLLQERVRAGVNYARFVKKIPIGRNPTPSEQIARIIEIHETGKLSIREIAETVKTPRSTVCRLLQQYKAGVIGKDGQVINPAVAVPKGIKSAP